MPPGQDFGGLGKRSNRNEYLTNRVMRSSTHFRRVLCAGVLISPLFSVGPVSAVPRDQLEADWLLQARLRWSPGEIAVTPALNRPATQSSGSQGSKTPPTNGQGIAWPAVLRATRDSGQALSDALEASATPDPEKRRSVR